VDSSAATKVWDWPAQPLPFPLKSSGKFHIPAALWSFSASAATPALAVSISFTILTSSATWFWTINAVCLFCLTEAVICRNDCPAAPALPSLFLSFQQKNSTLFSVQPLYKE
jgi:hypothetical protein